MEGPLLSMNTKKQVFMSHPQIDTHPGTPGTGIVSKIQEAPPSVVLTENAQDSPLSWIVPTHK
jgi:hypothetical protein